MAQGDRNGQQSARNEPAPAVPVVKTTRIAVQTTHQTNISGGSNFPYQCGGFQFTDRESEVNATDEQIAEIDAKVKVGRLRMRVLDGSVPKLPSALEMQSAQGTIEAQRIEIDRLKMAINALKAEIARIKEPDDETEISASRFSSVPGRQPAMAHG